MLTSSANQYLRPEYLTPLPTTLDAKKSPLALLAQTCSQIGIDSPANNNNNKSLLGPLDKSSGKSTKSVTDSCGRDKYSPSGHGSAHSTTSSGFSSASSTESSKSNSSFKPYESCVTSEGKSASPDQQQRVPSAHSTPGGSSSSRSRTPGSKRCSSNQSASSSSGGGRALTPQGRKSSTPLDSSGPRDSPGSRSSPSGPHPARPSPYSPGHPGGVLAPSDYSLGGYRPVSGAPLNLVSSSGGSSAATTTTTPSAAAYGLPYPPQLAAMDAVSQHHAALKSGLHTAHPYLSYARMKTPSGADTLVPVCRDPYCTGCQLNSHLLAATSAAAAAATVGPPATSSTSGKSEHRSSAITTTASGSGAPCPAGCAQCDHKSAGSSAAATAAALAAASSPYAAFAHAQLVALAAASQLPYACSWIGADAVYCGKRFASSDELLQHFRGHTTGAHAATPTSEAGGSAAAAAAAMSLLTPPGLMGPAHPLLARGYPTPPLSPLTAAAAAAAAARYHPYGKPYGAPALSPLGLAMPPPPHHAGHPGAAAGLPPYFSPYSLYASSRLGAASGMHP